MLSIGTGLLFGLFPALHSTRPDLVSTLKGQAGQPSGARGAARFRLALATAQIALSMVLLAASGFFMKSLVNVSRVDLGDEDRQRDHVRPLARAERLHAGSDAACCAGGSRTQLRAIPGVTGVTVALVPLLAGNNWGNDVAVQGFAAGPDIDSNSRFNEVGPGYFSTLGVPLMSGREFTDADAQRHDEGRDRQRGVREEVRPRDATPSGR